MKKKLKDTAVFRVLGSLVKGALLDVSSPILAAATGAVVGVREQVKKIKSENIADIVGGQGNPNYVRYVGLAIGIVIALYFAGVITEEQVNFVMELLEK